MIYEFVKTITKSLDFPFLWAFPRQEVSAQHEIEILFLYSPQKRTLVTHER